VSSGRPSGGSRHHPDPSRQRHRRHARSGEHARRDDRPGQLVTDRPEGRRRPDEVPRHLVPNGSHQCQRGPAGPTWPPRWRPERWTPEARFSSVGSPNVAQRGQTTWSGGRGGGAADGRAAGRYAARPRAGGRVGEAGGEVGMDLLAGTMAPHVPYLPARDAADRGPAGSLVQARSRQRHGSSRHRRVSRRRSFAIEADQGVRPARRSHHAVDRHVGSAPAEPAPLVGRGRRGSRTPAGPRRPPDQVPTLPHKLAPKLSRLIAQVCRPTIPSSPTWP
jgi:hypothetical protein